MLTCRLIPALLILLAALSLSPGSAFAERRTPSTANAPRPAPPGWAAVSDDQVRPSRGGVPAHTDPRDGAAPFDHLGSDKRDLVRRAVQKSTFPEIGGDEVLIHDDDGITTAEVEVAADGTIFVTVAVSVEDPWAEYIMVFRSLDGGDTFTLWHQFGGPGAGAYRNYDLDVTGGPHARIFVTYMLWTPSGFDVKVAFADPTAATPTWTTKTPVTGATRYTGVKLETDHRSFDSYYVYLVASGIDGNGDDIWFTRSTTQGDTWDPSYRIASLTTSNNLMYINPHVSYGYGGIVHVSWTYMERDQDTFDHAVRYRSATDYGAAAANWGVTYGITPIDDGLDQGARGICASLVDDTVVLLHSVHGDFLENPVYWTSTDAGLNWSTSPTLLLPWDYDGEIVYSLSGNQFVGTGIVSEGGQDVQVLARAPAIATAGWGAPEQLSDMPYDWMYWPTLALDPTHGDRVAVAVRQEYLTPIVTVDAEWRGDPGYPNFEPGLPRILESTPNSPPALVDLDGDGDQEIVYGTVDGLIEVRHHDGERAAGWPVALPSLTDGPIAIGELASGQLSVVAGTLDGRVHAYDTDGNLRPGWPHDLGTSAPAYVSIGALGGPYPRTVVAGSGNRVTFLNYRGEPPLDTFGWTFFTGDITTPAAIGDIDGDGVSELVVAAGSTVFGLRLYDPLPLFQRNVDTTVNDAVTLGDIDRDGSVEIAVPTFAGKLYVLESNGSDVAGWPFTAPSGTPLTSAAWAHIRGNTAPELAVAARAWNVHLLYGDGVEASGYPTVPGFGWHLLGAPIMGRIEGGSGDVVIGSRSAQAWAWDNFGTPIAGWPKLLGDLDRIELSPAMGDIDLDGRNEVVVLGPTDLFIVDVGSTPLGAINTWPMYGHDAQRSGCSDCVEDVATPVPDDPTRTTRVSFSGAFPNPVAGPSTQFRFAVPVRARASLEIYDIRGRRVQRILQEEVGAGEHLLSWNAKDQDGRSVASGQYLARLRVQGPNLNEDLTRRMTVLR